MLLAERLRPIENKPRTAGAWPKNLSWDRAIELLRAYARVGQSAERCVAALSILSAKIQSTRLDDHDHARNFEHVHSSALPSGEVSINTMTSQDVVDDGLDFPLELSDLNFNIDDMFWLNASAADIIF